MISRVKHLERYGLANEVEPGRWGVSDRAEGSLTELSERNDVIKTVISASSP
jgi:type IV secretory pathway VirD2 relaxase